MTDQIFKIYIFKNISHISKVISGNKGKNFNFLSVTNVQSNL